MKTRYVTIEVPETLRVCQFILNAIDWYNQKYSSAQDYFYVDDERFYEIIRLYLEFCRKKREIKR